MWNKISLAMKLGLGFGAVVIIAVALGTTALVNMKSVQQAANIMARENIPEVAVANNVERWSLKTLFEMRGYAYTEEESFLKNARENLIQVKKYLTDAKAHGESSPRLAKLKEAAQKAEDAVSEYETLVDETVDTTKKLEEYRQIAESAAKVYSDTCYKFLSLQENQNDDEF